MSLFYAIFFLTKGRFSFFGRAGKKKPKGIFLAVGLSALSFFVLKERTKKGCRANPSRGRNFIFKLLSK